MNTDQPEDDYADTLQAQMIADYVSGGTTLVDACKLVGIGYSTVFKRLGASERFAAMMEQARAAGYDVIANECLTIADDGTQDRSETGRLDTEHIQRSKLRVDTRMKLLAKWHPKVYGDKLQVEQKTATVAIPVTDDPIAAQRAYEQLMRGGD